MEKKELASLCERCIFKFTLLPPEQQMLSKILPIVVWLSGATENMSITEIHIVYMVWVSICSEWYCKYLRKRIWDLNSWWRADWSLLSSIYGFRSSCVSVLWTLTIKAQTGRKLLRKWFWVLQEQEMCYCNFGTFASSLVLPMLKLKLRKSSFR